MAEEPVGDLCTGRPHSHPVSGREDQSADGAHAKGGEMSEEAAALIDRGRIPPPQRNSVKAPWPPSLYSGSCQLSGRCRCRVISSLTLDAVRLNDMCRCILMQSG